MTPVHIPTTIFDRLRLAYQGFMTSTKPNPAWSLEKRMAERAALKRILDQLPPDVAEIVNHKTDVSEDDADRVVAVLPVLAFADQYDLLRRVLTSNPKRMHLKAFVKWATDNAPAVAGLCR